jgi:hypothetical protein
VSVVAFEADFRSSFFHFAFVSTGLIIREAVDAPETFFMIFTVYIVPKRGF